VGVAGARFLDPSRSERDRGAPGAPIFGCPTGGNGVEWVRMQLIDNIPVWGFPVDAGALSQIRTCAQTATHAALMADHHKGYAVPIGGVVAYGDKVSPSGVGYDIGCGNKAVLTDANYQDVRENIAAIMDDIFHTISFGVGRKNDDARVDHALFDSPTWSHKAVAPLKEMARQQLGTVGSGNHYVDLFSDEQGRVWIGVHFGSRGLGHKTATYFLKAGGASDGMDVPPLVIDAAGPLGADYLACMELAGRYAYAGRDWVCDRVRRILGANVLDEVHNHHNYAWREQHGDESLWVVRKGATPAFPGQRGFVGGSMGDISVIIEGVENKWAKDSLYSTVHGAGRVMGRMQAKGRYDRKTGECKQPGLVSAEMMREWVSREGVTLRGAGVDESPHCYKRLPGVLKEHDEMIRVLHTLTPMGVAMAGENELDPYKD
jgi:tRNA-splicing ligase RtcB